MKNSKRLLAWHGMLLFLLGLLVACGVHAADLPGDVPAAQILPESWLSAWKSPPLADRPLQIIHGIDLNGVSPDGIQQILNKEKSGSAVLKRLEFYKERGLGGVVCNVAFEDYLQSEEKWKTLEAGIDAFDKLGMVVWIYDEKGYPSGAAGGLVLKEHPEFEANELVWDAAQTEPLQIRPAYEHTHASNNFHAARRYVNLLDERAAEAFIAKTHQAYFDRLKPYFGRTIQATFTDEPSMIAINLGQLPESVRAKVPVVDPVDPAIKALPAIPWCRDLPQRYRERYGQDLMVQRKSLFAGQSADDRLTRRQFWSLVADLVADRYFGTIQHWCEGHQVSSSGHTLAEEALTHHTPLEGNALKVLGRMDIPGMDMLSSNPEIVLGNGWLTAGLPSSAAVLHGRRRIMTEVSDFSETLGGSPAATLEAMQATAAWQAAWGVTDFTLYYGIGERSVEQYREYCDYVGRLNAVLKPAQLDSKILLYYPIYDLWAEYLPVAEPLTVESQSPRAQRIIGSFMQLGQMLQRNQIPFTLVDHEGLVSAKSTADGKLVIGDHSFTAILLPNEVELESKSAVVINQFRQQGGRVLSGPWDAKQTSGTTLIEQLRPSYHIAPSVPTIALGEFIRDGRSIVLVVNVGRELYEGEFLADKPGVWQLLDPATGESRPADNKEGRMRLRLAPHQALLFVF